MDQGVSLRRILDDVAFCLIFFTRIGLGGNRMPDRPLGEAIWAAPVAGLAVALIGSAVYALAYAIGLATLSASFLALGAMLVATGCLHEDGLADVADGFGGGSTRERKLEIMRDSRIGTYGVAALIVTLGIKCFAMAQLVLPGLLATGLIAAHMGSRALLPAFMMIVPNTRSDGLSVGVGQVGQTAALTALALGFAGLLFLGLAPAIITALALAAWLLALRWLALRQIGGRTGDVLGALQQGGEVIVLLAATIALT
ncbi:adenosylcobinamide-GDP ribazoletransferase [Mesorhizobium xinjiangense]|uniref:adenosylcobinamide-GDP ribazoletransferase n=1 Tax=Mesorhizobium xinjiangense TaxID=2678685 RepID=UPI0012EDE4BD|nr:adenosylcobinamide-GDP ribazoletransferase [Mesorhizobium xinjiangense]